MVGLSNTAVYPTTPHETHTQQCTSHTRLDILTLYSSFLRHDAIARLKSCWISYCFETFSLFSPLEENSSQLKLSVRSVDYPEQPGCCSCKDRLLWRISNVISQCFWANWIHLHCFWVAAEIKAAIVSKTGQNKSKYICMMMKRWQIQATKENQQVFWYKMYELYKVATKLANECVWSNGQTFLVFLKRKKTGSWVFCWRYNCCCVITGQLSKCEHQKVWLT